MERRSIDQIIKNLNIELDESVKKSFIDEILKIHHEALSAEKNLTEAEKNKAEEANRALNDLQKSYDSAIKNSESLEALKTEMATLKTQNKQAIADIESKYQAKLLDNAIELALTQAGARNNKAAAALIDKSNLKLNEDGSVLGLTELIKSVKDDETTSFLFDMPKEEKQAYNYIPQGQAVQTKPDSIEALFNATNHSGSNAKIEGWD